MHILAEKEPNVYRKLKGHDQQISYAQRLADLLGQMPSDHTEIPSQNSKIRSELDSIRQDSMYQATEDRFRVACVELKELTLQWRKSRKDYQSSTEKVKYPFRTPWRTYHYCIESSKKYFESTNAQIRAENDRSLEILRNKYGPELESERVRAAEYLEEIKGR